MHDTPSVPAVGSREEWTRGGAYPVSTGVHRIPLPLPNDGLRAVNVYAIDDGDGLVLVDSGWALEDAREQLEAALGTLGHELGDVSRFLVTHVHRDHYTMALTLRRMFGSRIAIGRGEEPSLRKIIGREGRPETAHFAELRRDGATPVIDRLLALEPQEQTPGWELPDEWLADGAEVDLGGRTLRVVHTPGHTRGHVVFADLTSNILFAGDHVLPHITPSIGLEPARVPMPLADFLGSLRTVRSMPDLRLLPAHGPVTDSTHARVDELVAHHEQRLDRTLAVAERGASTAYEAALVLRWTRRERAFDELDPFNQMLAVMETAAHLDVLVRDGRLRASTVDGVARYTA